MVLKWEPVGVSLSLSLSLSAELAGLLRLCMEAIPGRGSGRRADRSPGPCRLPVTTLSYQQVFAGCLLCVVLALVLCYRRLPASPGTLRTARDPVERTVTLLLWWQPFGGGHAPMPDCAALYGIPGCNVTIDRRAYPRADAVLVHHRDIRGNVSALPQGARPPAQKWIWMNFESPSHTSHLELLEGLFNMTMSYKRGSDIFVPYGYLERALGPPPRRVSLPTKRRLVAWVVSNWNEDHVRVLFYWRLRRYIPIDVYGRAAAALIDNSVVRTVSAYKFYLAWENSQHTDYITEKLWRNALQSSAVPVVLGPPRSNYEKFLPADAFIHVDDFRGPAQLAAYLRFLARNPRRYRRYFAWKRHYSVHVASFWHEHYCAACTAVRAAARQTKVVSDLGLWFDT
ncbi:alpha-(1,3)-fucosyltransferase 4-like [Arapaima gigas]